MEKRIWLEKNSFLAWAELGLLTVTEIGITEATGEDEFGLVYYTTGLSI